MSGDAQKSRECFWWYARLRWVRATLFYCLCTYCTPRHNWTRLRTWCITLKCMKLQWNYREETIKSITVYVMVVNINWSLLHYNFHLALKGNQSVSQWATTRQSFCHTWSVIYHVVIVGGEGAGGAYHYLRKEGGKDLGFLISCTFP